jgi:hypothetical protein
MGIYTEQWSAIKRLERLMLGWFFIGLVIPILVAVVAPNVAVGQPVTVRNAVVFGYLGTWGMAVIYLRWRVGTFKCPRCDSSFDKNSRQPRKECANCGLKRYADS